SKGVMRMPLPADRSLPRSRTVTMTAITSALAASHRIVRTNIDVYGTTAFAAHRQTHRVSGRRRPPDDTDHSIRGGAPVKFSAWPRLSNPYQEVVDLCQHVERTGWDG